jgi:hypothetical protein
MDRAESSDEDWPYGRPFKKPKPEPIPRVAQVRDASMAEQSGEVGSSAGHAALTEVGSVGSEANLVAPVVSAESASSASESAPLVETATIRTRE